MTTMTAATAEVAPDTDVPVLVGLSEIVDLLPGRRPQTIYRWRLPRNGKPPELPAPLAIVSRTPLWRLETVLALAEEKGIAVDKKVLKRIRSSQGRRPN